jgi:pyroglutamyl-peptidase
VHLGLAGGRARIALERVAVNVMDFEVADNAGYRATGEPCAPDGPAAYFSTLPLEAILEALTSDGVPAYLSSTAGTYLCNQTFYTTRHLLQSRGLDVPAGFIHLPLSPSMVVAAGLDQPSMDVPLMIRAVEIALRVVTSGDTARRPR